MKFLYNTRSRSIRQRAKRGAQKLGRRLFSVRPQRNSWTRPYQAESVVSQYTILSIGAFVFLLAVIWPPLILLLAYVVAKVVSYSFRVNDSATHRRKLFHDFCQTADQLPEHFTRLRSNVLLEDDYFVSPRGMLLHTNLLEPSDPEQIEAVICYCHGYTDNASFTKLMENQRLVQDGMVVCALEYEGHGLSDGPLGLINSWDKTIDDVEAYFATICERFKDKPIFLMGESMGSAVAYCVYERSPHLYRGVVFVCPMLKISDHMLPPQWIIDLLTWLIGPSGTTSLLGMLPVAPSANDIYDVTYKIRAKWKVSARCPLQFGRKPRLATARELIDTTQRISKSLHLFDAPFLVLHGKADQVTDPALSQALYDESCSTDKSIWLYEGMWHALLSGEPDENIERVFSDISHWIHERI